MICPNCGQPVPDQSRFCENCGYPLQEESCEDNRTQPQPPKAHSNSTIIAIIVAAAAVLIVLIVCMTFLQKSKQDSSSHQAAQQTLTSAVSASTPASSAIVSAASSQAPASSSAVSSARPQTVNNYYYYTPGVGIASSPSQDYYNEVPSDGYLWPSDVSPISDSDLNYFSQDEVNALLNEIYARHGFDFQTPRWSAYFDAKSWYVRDPSCTINTVGSRLNSIEQKNVDTIVSYEKSHGWR